MMTIVAVLYLVGGALPVGALIAAAVGARRVLGKLSAELAEIERLTEQGADFDKLEAVRPTELNIDTLPWAADYARRTLYAELARPAVFAGIGVMLSTVASLLSLTL